MEKRMIAVASLVFFATLGSGGASANPGSKSGPEALFGVSSKANNGEYVMTAANAKIPEDWKVKGKGRKGVPDDSILRQKDEPIKLEIKTKEGKSKEGASQEDKDQNSKDQKGK